MRVLNVTSGGRLEDSLGLPLDESFPSNDFTVEFADKKIADEFAAMIREDYAESNPIITLKEIKRRTKSTSIKSAVVKEHQRRFIKDGQTWLTTVKAHKRG